MMVKSGKALAKVANSGQLGKTDPNVQRQPHVSQCSSSGAVVGSCQHPFFLTVFDLGVRVPSHRMPDATNRLGLAA